MPNNSTYTFDLAYNTYERLHNNIAVEEGGEVIIEGTLLLEEYTGGSYHAINLAGSDGDGDHNLHISFRHLAGEMHITAKVNGHWTNGTVIPFEPWQLGEHPRPYIRIAFGWNQDAGSYWGLSLDGTEKNVFALPEHHGRKSYYIQYQGEAPKPLFGETIKVTYNVGSYKEVKDIPSA